MADSNRSLRKRNWSLHACGSEFRILKNHRAETRPENPGLLHELPDIPRQRPGSWPLTARNVDTSLSAGNPYEETPVAGWGARIRTAMCPIQTGPFVEISRSQELSI